MLRRIEGLGALRLEWMDWDRAAMLMRKALIWTASAAGMLLLCRAQPAAFPAPFAMAFLAAALMMGRSAAALLAGCLAGGLNGPIQDFNLRLPIGAAIILGGAILWEQLGPRLLAKGRFRLRGERGLFREGREPAPGMKARSPNWAGQVVGSALAGAGVLIPGLLLEGGALWPSAARTVAGSVAAVAASPFFMEAIQLTPKRRRLNPEERIGLFLLAGAGLAGLARIYLPLALCAGGILSMLLYPSGALAGVGLAIALMTATGGDGRLPAMVALCGATAQLSGGLPRQTRTMGACASMLAAGLLLSVPPVMLAGAGASALAVLALPEEWGRGLAALAVPAPGPEDPQSLADHARRQSIGQLRALADAFGELAEGYSIPPAAPDEQLLMGRLRARLCEGCGSYGDCWAGDSNAGARFLCDLMAQAAMLSGEEPMFDGEVTPEILRRCRRGRLIPERVQEPLEDFARSRRLEQARGGENRLVSAQFAQARRLLEALAERQAQPIRLRAGQSARAAAALERAGLEVESALAVAGRGVEVIATLRQGSWTPELARTASAQLGRAFGRSYAPGGGSGRALRFARRPRLGVETGVACASRQEGAPSGDSHLIRMLDDERLLVLICDGMGSGPDAARESGLAVRLLGKFLRAGADSQLAIETVNALLLNRGGEDMFATMDLMILNLSTGEAQFMKLAACPTLIRREEAVNRVEGGRLPMGILERVRPGCHRARLEPGDVLMMGSDGVMDAAGGEALEELLLEEEVSMPELARRALEEAEAVCEAGRRDDRTAICLRIGLRQPGN